MTATKSASLLALAITVGLQARDDHKQRIRTILSERVPFVTGGTLVLHNSFGEVNVEGWDEPTVEITVTKATNKKYDASEEYKGREHLDRIRVDIDKESDDRLVVRTSLRTRSRFPTNPTFG